MTSCINSRAATEADKTNLSASERRFQVDHNGLEYRKSEFDTVFKYAPVKGLGYEKGVVRRDPTTIIKIGDLYYVWYTYMDKPRVGPDRADETRPAGPGIRRPEIVHGTLGTSFDPEKESICGPKFGTSDPMVVVRDGKYRMYYKGNTGYKRRNGELDRGIFCDLAIARRPGGPLIPRPQNPVINSRHETLLWPYKEGVAALVTVDGHEKSTIQYAPDGVNFEVKNIIEVPPEAGAVYCPDKYANTTNGQGVTWGLCHARKEFHEKPYIQENCLVRFKCDLHQDIHRHQFKTQNFRFTTDTLFSGKNRVKAADLRDNESPLPDGGDFLDEVFAHPEYD